MANYKTKDNANQDIIKTIFFDVGGVLLVDFIDKKIVHMAEKYHKDPLVLLKAKTKIRPFADLGQISDPEFWQKVLDEVGILATEDDWALDSYMQPIEGVLAIVKSLKQGGYRIAILSNDSREMATARRQKYRFDVLFHDIIISSEHGVIKPDPEIYWIALKRMRLFPENCLFIDDRQDNLNTAAEIGMYTILFQNANQLKNEMYSLGISLG